MSQLIDQAAHQLLQNKYDRLLSASAAARSAAKAYYAYRPASELDIPRKQELLQISKSRERELDRIILEEVKRQQTGQQTIF